MTRPLLLAFVLFWAWPGQAHEVRPAFLKLTELETAKGGELFEASLRQPQIDGRYLGLQLETNCESTPVSASLTSGALIEVHELDCSEAALETIEISGLERTLIDTLVSIRRLDGETRELLINGNESRIQLSAATRGLPAYFALGIEHLVFGFDHVLFVIMLLYIVRKPLDILVVVTSFTVAHSLTLALSAFDLLALSAAPAVSGSWRTRTSRTNLRSPGDIRVSSPSFSVCCMDWGSPARWPRSVCLKTADSWRFSCSMPASKWANWA